MDAWPTRVSAIPRWRGGIVGHVLPHRVARSEWHEAVAFAPAALLCRGGEAELVAVAPLRAAPMEYARHAFQRHRFVFVPARAPRLWRRHRGPR